jgi:DNA-binding NtrC family response regulator
MTGSSPEAGAGQSPRHERRAVRLGCWIAASGGEFLGLATNLSHSGIHLRLHSEGSPALATGALVRFRLLLPDGARPVEGEARVAWCGAAAEDRGVLRLGLEIAEASEDARTALAGFIRSFRFSVLVVDEDPDDQPLFAELAEEFRFVHCHSAAEALQRIGQEELSAILVTEHLPDAYSLTFFQQVSLHHPQCRASRLVLSEFTAVGQLEVLVTLGEVFSSLRRPVSGPALRDTLLRAAQAYALRVENETLSRELARANERLADENSFLRRRYVGREGFEQLVGDSSALRRALAEAERFRKTHGPVHIQGETGTGKELVARALHDGSDRRAKPFVAQNCAGLSEQLIHSSFFGHVRGAFTGADRDYEGAFAQADGGTLFLDEIAELPPAIQGSLLRVLQDGTFTPLGSSRPRTVDVRVISATHCDLRSEVAAKRFREDLFFRLVVLTLRLPALRERAGDIPMLAMHFLDLHCELKRKNIRGFTGDAMRALEQYPWPGNVRELANEIERLVVLGEQNQRIPLELIAPHLRQGVSPSSAPSTSSAEGIWIPADLPYDDALARLERTLVSEALAAAKGNVARAARSIGMERSRLAKLLERISPPAGEA